MFPVEYLDFAVYMRVALCLAQICCGLFEVIHLRYSVIIYLDLLHVHDFLRSSGIPLLSWKFDVIRLLGKSNMSWEGLTHRHTEVCKSPSNSTKLLCGALFSSHGAFL